MEGKTQKRLIKFLKGKKCYVLKTKPGPGTPVGCPDIIFMLDGFWGAIEVKAYANSKFQPLQKETIEKMDSWSWARVVHSENVDQIIRELDALL